MGTSRLLYLILIGAVIATFVYERNLAQKRKQDERAAELALRLPASVPQTTAELKGSPSPGPTGPTTADQVRIAKKITADSGFGADDPRLNGEDNESEGPEWGSPDKRGQSGTPKIAELFPEAKDLPLPDLLSHLAATDFQTAGPVVFEGADENYHEYDQNGPHGEQVQKYFSPAGGLAIEQINYSQDEQIVKRYSPQSALAEVSYEYKNQGGVLRFQPDGSVESFHTWDQNNNQILTRYNPAGQATEVWQWSPESDWKQVR